MINISESTDVAKTLQRPDIHRKWENCYRTAENERFYEQVFDYITKVLNAPKGSIVLDAGCGVGAHSIRLAKRGFSVLAVDISEVVLKTAEQNIQDSGQMDNIKLQHENILSLSFADSTFDYILCWGVLMHIPDIERAISELDRILKTGGIFVISEVNMFSFQAMISRNLRRLLGKEKTTMNKTAAGLEYWNLTSSEKLLTRQANIRWLKNKFKNKGFTVKDHIPGQFTELYTRFSFGLIAKYIHYFNYLWFKYIRIAHLAFGNIIILEKKE